MMTTNILKIFIPAVLSFIIGILITPFFTQYFYKYKLWKKTSRKDITTNPTITADFQNIHNTDQELSTPRVGGIIIWVSVASVFIGLWLLARAFPIPLFTKLQFFSTNQTLLPLFAFFLGSLFGLGEDAIEIFKKDANNWSGIANLYLIGFVGLFAIASALWFYFKLGFTSIPIPFVGSLEVGWLFIPFAILVIMGTFSSRVIDGIDGLAGGVMAIIYASFGTIALIQNQIDIATLCMVITGGILAFLWFNIPPARFYMGETGMLALTLTLAVIAFLVRQPLLLLVIGFPLAATSLSSTLQIISKKFRNGKKIFRVAPLHHHFQALGWSSEKVVMRYWIFTIMISVVGIIIALVHMYL